MNMRNAERFVLLIDHESPHVRKIALDLAADDGYVLIARSAASAVDFAKRYKPTHAVIAQSSANFDGKVLRKLLQEFSPETEIVIVPEEISQNPGPDNAAKGQSA